MTGIQWTDETWNPVVGCTRVSRGCDNCYAVQMTHRLEKMAEADEHYGRNAGKKAHYRGLTVLNPRGDRHFNGNVRCVESALGLPLRWRNPRRVFVNSMSDLFHHAVPFEFIDRVFAVMALTPQHSYQILTKRPGRMAEYLNTEGRWGRIWRAGDSDPRIHSVAGLTLPLPNVWLGTSCEDQAAADARIPHLLRCPAAVRFLSCEPLLGAVMLGTGHRAPGTGEKTEQTEPGASCLMPSASIDWVIVGGESGKNARPCDVGWIRSIVRQCKAARVPVFVKQLGKLPIGEDDDEVVRCHHCGTVGDSQIFDCLGADPGNVFCNQCDREIPCEYNLRDPKGGDPAEWPEDLRVREMPGESKDEGERMKDEG